MRLTTSQVSLSRHVMTIMASQSKVLIREEIMTAISGLEAISENHNRPIVCIDRKTSLNSKKFQIKNPINHEPLT